MSSRLTARSALFGLLTLLSFAACGGSDLGAPAYEAAEPVAETPVQGEPGPPPAPRVSQEPFVWRVTKGGKVSHLMGTIHVGVSLDEALTPRLQDTAANARVLVLEIDPTDLEPEALLAAARLPEGERQDRLYPPGVWHEIANTLNQVMNEQTLRALRPWFTMLLFMQTKVGELHEGPPPEGMDLTLFQMARQTDVRVEPLETVQDQIDAMTSVPNEMIARMLTRAIQEGAAENELQQLLASYRSADLAQVERVIAESRERDRAPEFHEALIDRRNEAWMEPLRSQLDRGDAFIAVGLGHLVGEEGILARLRTAGYGIERTR